MKILKYVSLTLMLIFGACASTNIPYLLSWSHDYKTTAGTDIDSSDLEFEVYIGDSLNLWHIDTTPDTSWYILGADSLYTDSTYFFMVKSRRISTNSYSEPSDTVSTFLPVLIPGKAYNLQVIQLK